MRLQRSRLCKNVGPVHARHDHITQQKVNSWNPAFDHGDSGFAVLRDDDRVTLTLEHGSDQ
jgi:hypothetical protein